MAPPYDIRLILQLTPKTREELELMADDFFAEYQSKYPNITSPSTKYATLSGVYQAAYTELLQKYNSLKSYIETLK